MKRSVIRVKRKTKTSWHQSHQKYQDLPLQSVDASASMLPTPCVTMSLQYKNCSFANL